MNASTRTELSAIVRTPLVARFAKRLEQDAITAFLEQNKEAVSKCKQRLVTNLITV